MGEPEKPKRAPRRKPDDKAQFERFFASVRKLGGQQSTPPGLEEASKKIVPPEPPKDPLVRLYVVFRFHAATH